MNKSYKIVVMLCVMLGMSIATYAKSEPIKLENKQVTLDVQEKGGRKLYPLRAICNELGIDIIKVTENSIVLKQGDNNVSINRKSQIVYNDNGYFVSDVIPLEINGTVYVPIRVISYMFGYNIDLSNGMALTKVQSFSMPKPSYGSTLLANDLRLISEMRDIVEVKYYLDRLEELTYVHDYFIIDMCKDYTIEDQTKLDNVAQYLKSSSGKVIYEQYYNLLNYFYRAFYYIENFNYEAFSKNMNNISKCFNELNSKLDIFLKEIYKNGTRIQ